MPGDHQRAVDLRAQQVVPDVGRTAWLGTLLQLGLRVVLIILVAATLLLEPPDHHEWLCATIVAVYAVVLGCWAAWVLRRGVPTTTPTRPLVPLLALTADVAVVSALAVLAGVTSPQDWTSDVIRNGFFLIPLLAAAQLDPKISAAVAIPTLSVFVLTCWITRSANQEPWASILLSSLVLAALAVGSVVLSFIQRSRVEMIADLARQRSQLLEELLEVERHERQAISERLHDGALQYILVARQDIEDVREGSADAADRVASALTECSGLLRDVVRELHPDVLVRMGLKSAIAALAESLGSRAGLTVEFDAGSWPDGLRTDADDVLYNTAREASNNVIKHARAQNLRIDLQLCEGLVSLRVADDGVGISEAAIARKANEGHIGMTSMRARVLASGGQFDVRSTSPGTELAISIPLGTARHLTAA
jgi:two-component system, NarL family, sensor kinase